MIADQVVGVGILGEDPGGIPSFGEGVSRSWNALIGFFKVAILALGLALPFIWVPPVLYVLVTWLRKRSDAGRQEPVMPPVSRESSAASDVAPVDGQGDGEPPGN